MELLYLFMSNIKVHPVYLEKQKVLHPTKQIRQLPRLSDTRWTCRYFAVDAVCHTFDSILATLEDVSAGQDRQKAVEANGILLQIKQFKFLLLLFIFDRILSCTKSLSDQLQSKTIDMAKAADLVSATVEVLKEFRTDSKWTHLYKYVEDVAALHNIATEISVRRVSRLPSRLDSAV